jgi:hypothetical protein
MAPWAPWARRTSWPNARSRIRAAI